MTVGTGFAAAHARLERTLGRGMVFANPAITTGQWRGARRRVRIAYAVLPSAAVALTVAGVAAPLAGADPFVTLVSLAVAAWAVTCWADGRARRYRAWERLFPDLFRAVSPAEAELHGQLPPEERWAAVTTG